MKKLVWMVPAMAGLVFVAGCDTTRKPQRPSDPIGVPLDDGAWQETQTATGVVKRDWVPAKEQPVPAVAQTTPYTVAKGDTLSGIAQQYGLRWQDIAAANPGLDPNKLRVNQVVYLPGVVDVSKKRDVQPRSAAVVPVGAKPPAVSDGVYVVKKGDTLSEIALKHGVKTAELKAVNGLASDLIREGQKLTLPAGAKKDGAAVVAPVPPKALNAPPDRPPVVNPAPVVSPAINRAPAVVEPPPVFVEPGLPLEMPDLGALRTHTVQEKEDIFTISLKYGVTPTELRELNNINVNNLAPGTELKIPQPAMPAP